MNEEKLYCGSGKSHTFPSGGTKIAVALDLDMLAKHFKEHGFTTQGGKRMIKVDVVEKREVDQYGKTHYLSIDTWKPDGQQQGNSPKSATQGFQDDDPDGNIPF